jgi:heptosyltransferase-2
VPGQPLPTSFEPVNLLVRGVNWLGDAVMTTPAMLRLRERFPRCRITLLTSAKLVDLWALHPAVDRVMTFGTSENPWTIGGRLRRDGFDAALVLPNSMRSVLEVWWAGIPTRIGYAGNWRRCFLTGPVAYPGDRVRLRQRGVREIKRLLSAEQQATRAGEGSRYVHQIHDYLELVSALGANATPLPPRLELSADEIESATAACLSAHYAAEKGERPTPTSVWLGLNPAAAYGPAKCWPVERFAEVAREVSKRLPNVIWLCFGAGTDWQICQKIVELAGNRVINLAGKTSVRQLMALLKKCRLLLTNDSGPMHIAAALGIPVVVPFGSTSPELTGPGQPGDPRHHLLSSAAACSPCFRRTCPIDFRCMTGISTERVVAAVLESFQGG